MLRGRRSRFAVFALAAVLASRAPALGASPGKVPVDVENFVRAESDSHFARTVEQGGFGKLKHGRAPTPIDQQGVVRATRDTLDSAGVFDLEAAPVKVTLPEPAGRYLSMQALSQDHFTVEMVDAPGTFTYTREKVGTRYLMLLVRTSLDSERKQDLKVARALQDRIRIEQQTAGRFETPQWDRISQDRVRSELAQRAATDITGEKYGSRSEVDPLSHLIGTAIGWGGAPRRAVIDDDVHPAANDGQTLHILTVREVPIDGFWSVSVYNKAGYFERDDLGRYAVNSLSAKPNRDGSYTIQFGGCRPAGGNCLPIHPGWSYTVRLYRPRREVLDGSFKFPLAKPLAPAPK